MGFFGVGLGWFMGIPALNKMFIQGVNSKREMVGHILSRPTGRGS